MSVKPTRIYRPRELESSESVDGTYDGDDVDWTTTPVGTHTPPSTDQWKQPVVAATTADITIATALNDADTLDGVTLATGDRVLVKDQTDAFDNGIYLVGTTPARAADFDADDEVLGAVVYVIGGTTNASTAWACDLTAEPVIGVDDITFASFGGGGSFSGDASDVPVVDAGGNYTGTDVEAVLAELVDKFIHRTGGAVETEFTHAAAGASETINLNDGNRHVVELSAATCALLISGETEGAAVTMLFVQDGTGGRLLDWSSVDIIWPGGSEPVLSTDPLAIDVITAIWYDAAATWIGFYGATPLTVGDTVESETTFGLTPDAGVSSLASRADHTHGTPDEPSGSGGGTAGFLLLADVRSSPIVFGDILQADDYSDLLYSEA